jgi:hypothetical protein
MTTGCRGGDTGSNSPLPDRAVPRDVPHSFGSVLRLRGPPAESAGEWLSRRRCQRRDPQKEGSQMLIAFLLLAGLLLWATGHMILR